MRWWRTLSDRVRQMRSRWYWRRRARRHGPRAVVNLAHPAAALAEVTSRQQQILLPLLQAQLRGDEALVLDLGCGPGRFTPALADLIGGHAIGVDPVRELLRLAPVHTHVEYRQLRGSTIPLPSVSVDVVWVCIVLGGITNASELQRTAAEIERVLRRGGLLFLVENTAHKPPARHWHYRSINEYQRIFPSIALQHVADYEDVGERISVLAGRRAP